MSTLLIWKEADPAQPCSPRVRAGFLPGLLPGLLKVFPGVQGVWCGQAQAQQVPHWSSPERGTGEQQSGPQEGAARIDPQEGHSPSSARSWL